MIKFFYNIIWWIVVIFAGIPLIFWALVRGENIWHRLGLWRCNVKHGIWIHASSLGETAAAINLARAIVDMGYPVVMTATTLAGYQKLSMYARELKNCDTFLQPIDHPLCVKWAVNAVKPKALVILELDMWLNMIYECKKNGALIFIASASISNGAKSRIKKYSSYFKAMWRKIDLIYTKKASDVDSFISFDVSSQKVKALADLKLTPPINRRNNIVKPVRFPVIIAGSIRSAEEMLIINSYLTVLDKYADGLLIIAPRHRERFSQVANIVAKNNIKFVKRSEGQLFRDDANILLLDTLGELPEFYGIGDIAIIGGTFAEYGGHNPMEAIFNGTPVIHGPSIHNNEILFNLIDNVGAGICVERDKLGDTLLSILSDSNRLTIMRDKCKIIIKDAKDISRLYAKNIIDEIKKLNI